MPSIAGYPTRQQAKNSKPPAPRPRRRRRLTLTAAPTATSSSSPAPTPAQHQPPAPIPKDTAPEQKHGAREGSQARRQEVDSEEGVAASAGAETPHLGSK